MPLPVTMGALCQCAFGAAPCPLAVTGQQQALGQGKPLATISDVTLPTFGTCISTLNPAVATILSTTGVLTPQPCVPAIIGVWVPGSPTVLVGGKPALNNTSKLMCMFGPISIVNPGTVTIQIK